MRKSRAESRYQRLGGSQNRGHLPSEQRERRSRCERRLLLWCCPFFFLTSKWSLIAAAAARSPIFSALKGQHRADRESKQINEPHQLCSNQARSTAGLSMEMISCDQAQKRGTNDGPPASFPPRIVQTVAFARFEKKN